MSFNKDPVFTKDLPDFVKVTQIADGYVLQVLDEAPFAMSPAGHDKVRKLFEILVGRGLMELPPSTFKPHPPPTPEQRAAAGMGGASAPKTLRRNLEEAAFNRSRALVIVRRLMQSREHLSKAEVEQLVLRLQQLSPEPGIVTDILNPPDQPMTPEQIVTKAFGPEIISGM